MGVRESVSNFFGGVKRLATRFRNSGITPLGGLTSAYNGNEPAWSDLKYNSLANEGYRKNVYAYACIRQIVMSTASVPWVVRKKDDDGKLDEVVNNHPLRDLIDRPNELQSWSAFIETFMTNLLISGNAYIYRANRGEGKPPGELWCIRPDRIRVIPGDQLHPIAGYLYTVGKVQTYYPPELIMHIKFYNPLDDWYGMSPLMAAMRSIDSNNELRKWNVSLLQNAARPSGALVSQEILDENNYQRLRAMIDELYSGSANAGRPIILEGNLDWKSMSMSPAEMSWGDALRHSSKEIAIALGVPPELVGDNTNKTFCLPFSSRIATPKGFIKIGELTPGDYVWSFADGKIVQSKVTKQAKTGRKELLKIVAGGNTITCTDNHPILVREMVKKGTNQHNKSEYRFVYKPAGEVTVGDVIISAHSYPEPVITEIPMPINNDVVEFAGAMLGDGFAHNYGGGRAIVSMAGLKGDVRDYYMGVAGTNFTKQANNVTKGRERVTIAEKEREFRFISKETVEILGKLGVTGGARNKTVPSWIFTQPLSIRRAFLRGLFDTDGSVDKKGRIKFGVSNEELCRGVRDLALSCGIRVGNVGYGTRQATLPDGTMMESELWSFSCTVPSLNLTIGSRNPSDVERMRVGAANIRSYGAKKVARGCHGVPELPEGLEYSSVKSIDSLPAEDVYDIEVEGTHNFFAENVCVHNSNFGEARKAFYEETILPLLGYIEAELNNWLTPLYPDAPYLKYNKDEISALKPDLAQDRQSWIMLFTTGAISVNELRQKLGLDDKDGGDELMAILQQKMIGGGMGMMGGAPPDGSGGGAPVDIGIPVPGGAPAAVPGEQIPGAPAGAPGAAPAPGAQPAQGTPQEQAAQQAAQKPLTVASIVQELISEAAPPEEDEDNALGLPPGGIKSLNTRMYAYGMTVIRPSQRKERNTDHYTYPLDDNTVGTFNSDKTEIGKYFKGVFVSNLIRRTMPMFQQDWNAMDDLHREILACIICEGSARVFPTRELYDEFVAPYGRAMQKGNPDPDGQQWQADPWKNMSNEELYAKAQENYTQLNTMLQSGQYNIMDKRLYPYAAKALLFARMLYHKLLLQQIEGAQAAGKSIFGEEPPGQPAPVGASAEAAPEPAEESPEAKMITSIIEKKRLADMAERMAMMMEKADSVESNK